jgi:hypothetical protein
MFGKYVREVSGYKKNGGVVMVFLGRGLLM